MAEHSTFHLLVDRGLWIFNAVAIVGGSTAVYVKWWDSGSTDARVGLVSLTAFTGLIYFGTIWQQFRYSRKARYAEAVYYLRDAFARLNSAATPESLPTSQIADACQAALDRLAHIFLLVTGTRCRVCIKLFETPGEGQEDQETRPAVFTLVRDRMSSDDIRRQRRANSPQTKHLVDENTDFREIYSNGQNFFLCNNLPRLRDYSNTSIKHYGGDPASRPPLIVGPWAFWRNWKLPYISTLVVPIMPATAATTDTEQHGLTEVGYLCVDSPARGVFQRRYDVPLMEAFSDAIYPLLRRYHSLQQNSATQTQGGK